MEKEITLKAGDRYIFNFEQDGIKRSFAIETMVSIDSHDKTGNSIVPKVQLSPVASLQNALFRDPKFSNIFYIAYWEKTPAMIVDCIDGSLSFENLTPVK